MTKILSSDLKLVSIYFFFIADFDGFKRDCGANQTRLDGRVSDKDKLTVMMRR